MKKKKGFTLAEVLITLGIIGVVAAMTIPTLINNNQKTQYVTGLKKAYTQFNQALVQMAADNGCVGDLACTGFFMDTNTLGTELVKYFKVVKLCGIGGNPYDPQICFSDQVSTRLDGSNGRGEIYSSFSSDPLSSYYGFITTDGMSVAVGLKNLGVDCTSDYSSGVTGNMKQVCGEIWFDINGFKGPNNYGRDIFQFFITNGKGPLLYPQFGQDSNWGPGTWEIMHFCNDPSYVGDGCAARIIEEGWKMNY